MRLGDKEVMFFFCFLIKFGSKDSISMICSAFGRGFRSLGMVEVETLVLGGWESILNMKRQKKVRVPSRELPYGCFQQ